MTARSLPHYYIRGLVAEVIEDPTNVLLSLEGVVLPVAFTTMVEEDAHLVESVRALSPGTEVVVGFVSIGEDDSTIWLGREIGGSDAAFPA